VIQPEDLEAAFSTLTDREQQILDLRLGISGVPHTLAKVGSVVHLSRDRIRQIQEAALRKMRRHLAADPEGILASARAGALKQEIALYKDSFLLRVMEYALEKKRLEMEKSAKFIELWKRWKRK
jgi:hypothetical protein